MQLGEHCSEREQRAEQAERELTKLKLLNFLRKRIGKKIEAVVTGVESFGMFVMGLKLPAEGLVHLDSIEDDIYDYDDTIHALTGRRKGGIFSLGDIVEVEIAIVDMDRRELDLRLVRKVSGREQPRTRRSDRKKSRGGKASFESQVEGCQEKETEEAQVMNRANLGIPPGFEGSRQRARPASAEPVECFENANLKMVGEFYRRRKPRSPSPATPSRMKLDGSGRY